MARFNLSPILALLLIAALVPVARSYTSSSPSTPTSEAMNAGEETTTAGLAGDDICSRCDYTEGQIWAADPDNCHRYYVCEPVLDGKYRQHHFTCGAAIWDQAAHTCVENLTPEIDCGPIVTAPVISTTPALCPYEVNTANLNEYILPGDDMPQMYCLPGMTFSVVACTCVGNPSSICEDDLLLHFPFDEDYRDVSCHKAEGIPYGELGEDIAIDDGAGRATGVVCLDGGHIEVPFVRTWFIRNQVNKFSITLWFRSDDPSAASSLVNNGDCEEDGSFQINVFDDDLLGGIRTGTAPVLLSPLEFGDGAWHFAALVYDGETVSLYLDDNPVPVSDSASGDLVNTDVPMYIGVLEDVPFIGCIDDLRVYTKSLDASDRAALYSA